MQSAHKFAVRLGAILRDLRRRQELTQEQVGMRMGSPRSSAQSLVARLESGRRGRIRLDAFVDFVHACGVRTADYVDEVDRLCDELEPRPVPAAVKPAAESLTPRASPTASSPAARSAEESPRAPSAEAARPRPRPVSPKLIEYNLQASAVREAIQALVYSLEVPMIHRPSY